MTKLSTAWLAALVSFVAGESFTNPILPGFHPDPSCIYDSAADKSSGTYFCVSSSFNAFPGIPIHASKDLQHWSLIGHALNRPSQLPGLAETNRSTSGIWAPAIRKHGDTFYVVTTLVNDDLLATDASRWDNIIFSSDNLYDDQSWSDPVHFDFEGYDPSPFWDEDGQAYMVASHAWKVEPGIRLATVNLETGKTGDWTTLWLGTGGIAPEGPHIYEKDGYYYLLIAEGGTGLGHMVTMARADNLTGPYTPHPHNPVLTSANTTNYFQTVGHADLIQDPNGNWWSVALSTRSGPEFLNYPMGRETVMTTVQWASGEWPTFTPVNGTMDGPLPTALEIDGPGVYNTELNGEDISFSSEKDDKLPPHFTYWRAPIAGMYEITKDKGLRLLPSRLNLTALNGNYAGELDSGVGLGSGQTFVGRRQQHTLFTYRVDLEYSPDLPGDEAGVSVFLTQNHHLDLGIVNVEGSFGPCLKFFGISSNAVPDPVLWPIPETWYGRNASGPLQATLQIEAANATHYVFSAWPTCSPSTVTTLAYASNNAVSWGFTGTLVGVYCTTNGRDGPSTGIGSPAHVTRWQYIPQGQIIGE